MTLSGVDDLDLGPWAAYVVGRHPYALADWHDESWSMTRKLCTISDQGHVYGSPRELGELDDALSILARQARIDTAVLDRFRQNMGRFIAVSKDLYDNSENPTYGSEEIDWEAEDAPAGFDLRKMMWSSTYLIKDPVELSLWEQCGAAIGVALLSPDTFIFTWRWENTQESVHAMLKTIQKLDETGQFPFLLGIADHLSVFDSQSASQLEMHQHVTTDTGRQAMAGLDDRLRNALRTQALPKIWLDINSERVIFFDERYYVGSPPTGENVHDYQGRLPQAEAAILWVLADRLGQYVPRTLIRLEGAIESDEEELTTIASRLRKQLKPAIETYMANWGLKPPDHANMCFIDGTGGPYQNGPDKLCLGPYNLKLPAYRVRLSAQRPPWVGPRHDT